MIRITHKEKIEIVDLWYEVDDAISNLKLWILLQESRYSTEGKYLLSQIYKRLKDIDDKVDILGTHIRRLGYDDTGRLRLDNEEESTMHFHIISGFPGCYPECSTIARDYETAQEIAIDYIKDEIEFLAQLGLDDDELDDYEIVMIDNIKQNNFTYILPDEKRYLEINPCLMKNCLAGLET